MSLTLNQLESNLIHEIEQVRRNPQGYADILEKERRPYYKGAELTLPDDSVLTTQEGVHGCEEAISFLLGQAPLPDLKVAYGMTLAAQEAVHEHGPSGTVKNVTATGETVPLSVDKLERFGKWEGNAVEVNGFGGVDARGLVLSFLISDGDPHRTHREALFNQSFTHIGLGAGPHSSTYKIMACVNLTKNWQDK